MSSLPLRLLKEKFVCLPQSATTNVHQSNNEAGAVIHVLSSSDLQGEAITLKPKSNAQYMQVDAGIESFPSSIMWIEQLQMSAHESVKLCIPLLVDKDLPQEECANIARSLFKQVMAEFHKATDRRFSAKCVLLCYRSAVREAMEVCAGVRRPNGDKQLVVLCFPTLFVDFMALHLSDAIASGVLVPHPRLAHVRRAVKLHQRGNTSILSARNEPASKAHELSCLLSGSEHNVVPGSANADVHLTGQPSLVDAVRIRQNSLRYRATTLVSTGWRNVPDLSPEVVAAFTNWTEVCTLFNGATVTRYMASVSPSSGYMTSIVLQLNTNICLNHEGFLHAGERGSLMRIDRSGAWLTCPSSATGREWPDGKSVSCQECSRKNTQKLLLPTIKDELLEQGVHLNALGLIQLPVHLLSLLGLCVVSPPSDRVSLGRTPDEHRSDVALAQQVTTGERLSRQQIVDLQASNRVRFARQLKQMILSTHLESKLLATSAPNARPKWFVETNAAFLPCNDIHTLLGDEPPSGMEATSGRSSPTRPPCHQRLPGISRSASIVPPTRRRREASVMPAVAETSGDMIVFGHPLIDFNTSTLSKLTPSTELLHSEHWAATE